MIPAFLARRRTSACQGPSRPRSEPDPSAEETALRAAAAQPAGLRAPLPPASPGAWGGGGRGPSGTPSRLRGKISATLCSCSRQSAGRSPGRGRDCQGGWSLAPHPRFPRALKPALASVPRGHGSPVGLGTLYPRPDSSHRPRAAWRGRRRAASLSHGDSRVGLLASHLGAPHVALGGGRGLGRNCSRGAHPLSSRPVVATTVITAPWPSASRARARAADRACRNPAIRSHFNDYYYISDDCKNSLLFSVCG